MFVPSVRSSVHENCLPWWVQGFAVGVHVFLCFARCPSACASPHLLTMTTVKKIIDDVDSSDRTMRDTMGVELRAYLPAIVVEAVTGPEHPQYATVLAALRAVASFQPTPLYPDRVVKSLQQKLPLSTDWLERVPDWPTTLDPLWRLQLPVPRGVEMTIEIEEKKENVDPAAKIEEKEENVDPAARKRHILAALQASEDPAVSMLSLRRIEDGGHKCYGQLGVFASVLIPAGQCFWPYGGVATDTTRQDLAVAAVGHPPTVYAYAWDHYSGVLFDGFAVRNILAYCNDGNGMGGAPISVAPVQVVVAGIPLIMYIATKDIPAGKEVFVSYGTNYWHDWPAWSRMIDLIKENHSKKKSIEGQARALRQQNEELAASEKRLEEQAKELRKKNTEIEQQNERLTEAKRMLSAKNGKLNIQKQDLAAQAEVLLQRNEALAASEKRLEEQANELRKKNTEIDKLNFELKREKQSIENSYDTFKKRTAAAGEAQSAGGVLKVDEKIECVYGIEYLGAPCSVSKDKLLDHWQRCSHRKSLLRAYGLATTADEKKHASEKTPKPGPRHDYTWPILHCATNSLHRWSRHSGTSAEQHNAKCSKKGEWGQRWEEQRTTKLAQRDARLEAAGVANEGRVLQVVSSLMMIVASEYYQTNASEMDNPKDVDHAAARLRLTLGNLTSLGRLMNFLDFVRLAQHSRTDFTTMLSDFAIKERCALGLSSEELRELSDSVLQAHKTWLKSAEEGYDPHTVTVRQSPFFPVIETCKRNSWSGKEQAFTTNKRTGETRKLKRPRHERRRDYDRGYDRRGDYDRGYDRRGDYDSCGSGFGSGSQSYQPKSRPPH